MDSFDSNLDRSSLPPVSIFENALRVARLIACIVGLVVLFMGLNYSVKIFYLIQNGIENPKQYQAVLDQWVDVVGGNKLDVVIDGVTYSVARPLAIFVVGGAICILVTIALTFMGAGAKIISITTSDQEAVKKILRNAFGYVAANNLSSRITTPKTNEKPSL